MPETDQKPAEQAPPADKGQRRTAPAPAPEPPPAERQGATIRGRAAAIGNRYLEAARALGDELVEAVLGPAPKT